MRDIAREALLAREFETATNRKLAPILSDPEKLAILRERMREEISIAEAFARFRAVLRARIGA